MSAQAERVRNLVELGRFATARPLLAPLLAADPHDADLHELDAAVCDGLGDEPGVLAAAGRAAALAPDRESPHRLMAYAHHALGEHDAAHQSAREAVRLAPLHWAPQVTLATMASALPGHGEESTAAAARALELAPDNASAHFAAGYAAQGRGRRREARAHYRRALGIDPQHPQALNNLTMVTGRGRPDRALRGYAEALRADPQGAVPLANLQTIGIHLLRRVLVLGLVAVVAGVLLTGLGTSPVNTASQVAGVAVAAAVVAAALVFASGCSRPVRSALWQQLGSRWEFWTVLVAAAAVLAFGLCLCWVDGVAHAVARHGLFLWLLFVWPVRTVLKSWWRGRRDQPG